MSGGSKMIKAATSSEGDPWAYDFASGELFAASGGVMEFIEILKLDKEHLLPILTLNEEGKVKPSKQPQVEVDEFVIAHTNLPEYEAKAADPEMAATWDRMKIVRFPYNTAISSEQAIYERSLPLLHQQGINVAPHTMRTASLWVILSRLLPAKDRKFDPLTKARLYNGEPNKDIGMAEIRALKKEGVKGREGMEGISPRKLKDNVIPAIMTHPDVQKTKSIDGYGVLTIIRDKLDSGEIELEGEVKDKAYQNLEIALKDLDEHVKEDVTEAIAGDRDNLNAILDEYLRNVEAFVDKKDVSDWRGISSGPSEQLMQSIEKKMGVSDNRTHRQKLNAILGSYRRDGKPIDLDLFPDIKKAIVQHELEQLERNIPWKALCTTEPLSTKKQEDYRQGVIGNLKKKGYDEESARHALARVGSLFNTNK
jgi:serine protein kinase